MQMCIPRSLRVRRTFAPRRQREVTPNLVQSAGHKGQTQRLRPDARDCGIQKPHRHAKNSNPQARVERTMEIQNDEKRQQPGRGCKQQSSGTAIFGVGEPTAGKTACEEPGDPQAGGRAAMKFPCPAFKPAKVVFPLMNDT